jgi:hypothetical protein
VPIVPTAESRTFIGTVAMPPTPFLGTQGEADTPRCGRIAANSTRLSDERFMTDDEGNRFELDGEIWIATFEWVSPRFELCLAGHRVPMHAAVSLTAYSLQYGWLDEVRDFVENDLLSADANVDENHTPIGKEFSYVRAQGGDKVDALESEPMMKAKLIAKFPLSEGNGCGGGLRSALSAGLVLPAFGEQRRSGNTTLAADVALALALPLNDCWRLTGAAAVTFPGCSDRWSDLHIPTNDVVFGANVGIEWWVSRRFAIGLGATLNGPWSNGSGLPTDLWSVYVNLGLLYRPTPCTEIHLVFSENPSGGIDFDNTPDETLGWDVQRDADFSLTLGASWAF